MTIKFPRYFTWGRAFNPAIGYYRLDSDTKGSFVSSEGERKGPGLAFCLERVRFGDLAENTRGYIEGLIGRSPEWRAIKVPAPSVKRRSPLSADE